MLGILHRMGSEHYLYRSTVYLLLYKLYMLYKLYNVPIGVSQYKSERL